MTGALKQYLSFINRDLPLREKVCTSKIPYVSRREATTTTQRQESVKPYRCQFCTSWHVGHQR